MTLGKVKAQHLIRDLSLDSKEILLELEAICAHRGARVRYAPQRTSEAMLLVFNGRGIITINSHEPYVTRQRFSIAHELGHFEMHKEQRNSFYCDKKDMIRWSTVSGHHLEIEANEFAAELLMPDMLFRPEAIRRKPSMAEVENLASEFSVSLSAAARRYIDTTDEACALVFFSKNKTEYSLKSKAFSELNYWISSGTLDQFSEAYRSSHGQKTANYMTSVDANCWIEDLPRYLQEETLLEEARYFPQIELGLTLLWIKNGPLLRY